MFHSHVIFELMITCVKDSVIKSRQEAGVRISGVRISGVQEFRISGVQESVGK